MTCAAFTAKTAERRALQATARSAVEHDRRRHERRVPTECVAINTRRSSSSRLFDWAMNPGGIQLAR